MAGGAPREVVEVALTIPDTANVSVLLDKIDIAVSVPAELAVGLVPQILRGYEGAYAPRIAADRMARLASHLASDGRLGPAIDVAAKLFEIHDYRLATDVTMERQQIGEVRGAVDSWHYHRFLQEIVRSAPILGLPLVNLIADRLRDAVEMEAQRYNLPSGLHDRSDRLSDLQAGEPERNIEEALIQALLDAARLIIRERPASLTEVLAAIERHDRSIFKRIALVLVAETKPIDAVAARRFLMDRDFFELREVRREYRQLLEVGFPILATEDKGNVLAWIDEGPDVETWKAAYRRSLGEELSPEQIERHRSVWQFEQLYPLRKHLRGEREELWRRLRAEHGPLPSYQRPAPERARYVGFKSPKSAADLSAMEDGAIVSLLREWRSPRGSHPADVELDAPTREGLGTELKRLVATEPERFARLAGSFCGLDPTYVRSLFDGFQGVLREEGWFEDWNEVIELAKWVVTSPRTFERTDQEAWEFDSDWGSTRLSIARLLEAGFAAKEHQLAINLRTPIWEILLPLTEDPDPVPEGESANDDPAVLSVNSVRGEALHCVVGYALWVHRMLPGREGDGFSFEKAAEVREVLDAHLDITRDPSFAIRSVYGRWFPWFVLLDTTWTADARNRIFPSAAEGERYWRAAWSSYVTQCEPYGSILPLLRAEYERAVSLIGSWGSSYLQSSADERLAEHLVLYYARGNIPLNDPLLHAFWQTANPEVRRQAMWFGGQLLHRGQGESQIPEEVVIRLQALWQMRCSAAEHAEDPGPFVGEMKTFGYWFAHGSLPDEWSIPQLERAARIAKDIDLDLDVVRKLAELADRYPAQALRILDAIADGDEWSHLPRDPNVEIVVQKGSAGAPDVARQVIQRLAMDRQGWLHLLSFV